MCWVKSCLSSKRAEVDSFAETVGMTKLVNAGVVPLYVDFLNAYLESRIGRVAVEGVLSHVIAFFLQNNIAFPLLILGSPGSHFSEAFYLVSLFY